jgi:hypothetical protein
LALVDQLRLVQQTLLVPLAQTPPLVLCLLRMVVAVGMSAATEVEVAAVG